jgi:hypothetical protein
MDNHRLGYITKLKKETLARGFSILPIVEVEDN